jgi:hypothetical protein
VISGFTPWTLLLSAGNLTCLPIIPPAAYFSVSGTTLVYTSTLTNMTRAETLDGKILFSESGPGTADGCTHRPVPLASS